MQVKKCFSLKNQCTTCALAEKRSTSTSPDGLLFAPGDDRYGKATPVAL